jgi:hypothetical protein
MTTLDEIQNLVKQYGSVSAAAKATGVAKSTLQNRLKKAQQAAVTGVPLVAHAPIASAPAVVASGQFDEEARFRRDLLISMMSNANINELLRLSGHSYGSHFEEGLFGLIAQIIKENKKLEKQK